MPATSCGNVDGRLSIEPRRALLTPSASPSVAPPDRPPAKRPRFRSTPSSCVSATPSTSNESTSSADVDSARRASTLRVLNVWAQLAERYNKRLDEDDIIDLHSCTIIKDRGVCRDASREYLFGHVAQPDGDQDFGDQDSEQDDDDDELNAHPPSETTTDDDVAISKKELLRGVPPLSATTDAEDLREFLEAEKRRRVLAGDEEDEEDLSPERLSALRKALEEHSRKEETAAASQAQRGATSANRSSEVDITPTRPSTRVPPSDDESEDELGLWVHDESTALHPVARVESEEDMHRVGQEVIELTDSDSDREFEALLTRPSRFVRSPPLPIPPPREVQQALQSPPDSEHGRPKSQTHSKPKTKSKTEVMPKSQSRPRSPLVFCKPEITLTHKRKSSVSKEIGTVAFNGEESDQEAIFRAHKGKCKEIQTPPDQLQREKTPKPPAVSRGRKRKRIVSSTNGGPLSQSPDQKKCSQSLGRLLSQSPTTLLQPNGAEPTLDKNVSIPSPRHSRSFSVSKPRQPTSSTPGFRSPESESIQSTAYGYNSDRALPSDPTTTVTHPYSQRGPLSIFSSPNQRTPGSPHPNHVPPPMDTVQTQQAHYLLAQAMQQLSYLLSATMPSYATYQSNPGQLWHHSSPLPHAAYSTPAHHPSQPHDARAYHTPSSSISRSGLPPSSPIRSLVSSPVEEPRSRGRGRSKSRGRRVSYKDNEEVTGNHGYTIQSQPHHSEHKAHRQNREREREGGEERETDVFDDPFREDRGSPPREVARGRTPGPPTHKKIDASRGRPLSRR